MEDKKDTWKDFLKSQFDEQMRIVVKWLMTARNIVILGTAYIILSVALSGVVVYKNMCDMPKMNGGKLLMLQSRLFCVSKE